MRHFQHKFLVEAPISKVAEFHQDTRSLKGLTPPPIYVSFNEIQPLAENSVADFTMWLGPLPVRWVAMHSNVKPLNGFTDTQLSGPFEQWVHQHAFQSLGPNRTEIIDTVEAQPSNHVFWGLVSRFMWLNLPFLFAYRAWRTRKALEK